MAIYDHFDMSAMLRSCVCSWTDEPRDVCWAEKNAGGMPSRLLTTTHHAISSHAARPRHATICRTTDVASIHCSTSKHSRAAFTQHHARSLGGSISRIKSTRTLYERAINDDLN